MKKLLAMLLTLVMALSVTTLSWAEERVVPVYPEGVTTSSFPDSAPYTKPGTNTTEHAAAVVAYVGTDGTVKYAAEVNYAIADGATVVYMKENANGRLFAYTDFIGQPNRTSDLIADLTIYGNGADFQYGEIAMNTSDAGKAANITVTVYDAKNIKIWGNTPNAGVTQTIIMDNCHNEGQSAAQSAGEMMLLWGETGTVNATFTGCSVKSADLGIYYGCDGSLNVTESQFSNCATGIKISYKGSGTRTDTIIDCTFTECGITEGSLMADSAAIKIKSNGAGTLTATIDNATITGTVGGKGDIQIESKTADKPAGVTVKNTEASVSVTKPGVSDAAVTEVKTVTKNDTLTIATDGGAQVIQPETPPRYYYNSTTTDTKADGTKGSPKTFDAGVGIYALTAVLSVTGMACVGKKKF